MCVGTIKLKKNPLLQMNSFLSLIYIHIPPPLFLSLSPSNYLAVLHLYSSVISKNVI